jgi:TRAP-type C4-dicarboxylate transport system permease small subunit
MFSILIRLIVSGFIGWFITFGLRLLDDYWGNVQYPITLTRRIIELICLIGFSVGAFNILQKVFPQKRKTDKIDEYQQDDRQDDHHDGRPSRHPSDDR